MSDDTHTCFAARLDKKQIEDGLEFAPKFDENGLLAAVAIDVHTREPLMLAWMNRESLRLTLEKGEAVYWSRSRQEIWHKGATSGQIQKVIEMRTDCDQDAVILYVEQAGGELVTPDGIPVFTAPFTREAPPRCDFCRKTPDFFKKITRNEIHSCHRTKKPLACAPLAPLLGEP